MTTFYLVCAGIGGLVLVLQVLLSFLGVAEHHDLDSNVDDGLDLLSVRALSAGIAFFGVGGLSGLWLGLGGLLALPIGAALGVGAMFVTAKATRVMLSFESDRTPLIEEAIGERAIVYLGIPGQGAGVGKVHVNLRGRLVELEAKTTGDPIPTGASVQVVDSDGETLVVSPLKSVG